MKTQTKQFAQTLQEAILHFSDPDVCVQFVANLRWENGTICPRCGSDKNSYIKTRRIWQCKNCKRQFSVKVGTIFEDSPIPLEKWLPTVWMVVNDKNGISSYEMARALHLTQKSAWFMDHRIRLALQEGTFEKLSGQVETDETFVGGKIQNMHKDRRPNKSEGETNKTIVLGMLERGNETSNVRAKVIPDTSRYTLQNNVRANVEKGTQLFTDAHPSYDGLGKDYTHQVIDHALAYAKGQIHTNGVENFWSVFKRGLKGTYIHVDPDHLFRYLDEQVYRFNNRSGDDAARFIEAVKSVRGKRLTYNKLTGK